MPAGAGFRAGTHELLLTVHSGDHVEVRYDADLFEPRPSADCSATTWLDAGVSVAEFRVSLRSLSVFSPVHAQTKRKINTRSVGGFRLRQLYQCTTLDPAKPHDSLLSRHPLEQRNDSSADSWKARPVPVNPLLSHQTPVPSQQRDQPIPAQNRQQ